MSTIRRLLPRVLTPGRLHNHPWASLALLTVIAALSTFVPPFDHPEKAQASQSATAPEPGWVEHAIGRARSLLMPAPGQAEPAPQPPAPPPAGPPPAWASSLPAEGVAWAPAIQDAAVKEGLDPRLLASVVWVESAFNPAAASPKGAVGLAQVMPTTAADLGVNPNNPVENLAGGARYLKHNLDRFGKADLALAAYNAGPTKVAEVGGIPAIPETQNYVVRVLDTYRRLGG